MITIHDVRGAPVSGLPPAPRATPARAAAFHALLEQLAPPAGAGPTRAPAAPVAVPPAVRTPVRVAARPPAATAASGGARAAARARLAEDIRAAAGRAGVDPALSVAVARAESNLDPAARSSDGLSVGTFQVTWYTKAEMRRKIAAGIVERPPGPDDVALGVGYLRYLHDLFARDARLAPGLRTVAVDDAEERRRFAVAAFNAGEGRVARAQARVLAAGGDPTDFDAVRPHLPRITRGYVDRVMAWADGGGPETLRS
jgi:soluble lytic murein transglycosylase-like protein